MLRLLNQFLAQTAYSLEDYIALEERTGVRHEYHNGKLRPIPGGSQRHSQIAVNITTLLSLFIRKEKLVCKVFNSDLKVALPSLKKFLYPDAMVCCGEPAYGIEGRTDSTKNPQILFEVLSPSTEGYDASEKFEIYKKLESLREYVLVQQAFCRVEVRTLVDTEKGLWKFSYYNDLQDVVKLDSLGAELPLSEIYYDIEFDDPEEIEEPVEA